MPTTLRSPVVGAGRDSPSPPTTRSPVVTLNPTPAGGQIPGPASDSADFYGLGAAVLAIALIVVVTKLAFRNRRRPEQQERSD